MNEQCTTDCFLKGLSIGISGAVLVFQAVSFLAHLF